MGEIIYNNIKYDIDKIEKETNEILQIAEQISDRFNGIGQDIREISGIVGKIAGKNIGTAVNVIGYLVQGYGEYKAEQEKEKILQETLPKKQELAKAKIEILKIFQEHCKTNHPHKIKLLEIESNRTLEDFDTFKKMHAEGAKASLEMTMREGKIIQVLEYTINEFNAWLEGRHQSNQLKPKNYKIYKDTLDILLPNGLIYEMKKNIPTAGYWMFTKYPILFGTHIFSTYIQNKKNDKNNKRVFKQNDYLALKTEIRYLETLDKSENKLEFKWLKNNEYYQLFESYAIYNKFKIENINLQFLLYGLNIFTIFTVLLSLIYRFIYYTNVDNKDTFENNEDLFIKISKVLIGIVSLGSIPFAYHWYKKKEENYRYVITTTKENIENNEFKETINIGNEKNTNFITDFFNYFNKDTGYKIMSIIYLLMIPFFSLPFMYNIINEENVQKTEISDKKEEIIINNAEENNTKLEEKNKELEVEKPLESDKIIEEPKNKIIEIKEELLLNELMEVDGLYYLNFKDKNGKEIQIEVDNESLISKILVTNTEYQTQELNADYINKRFMVTYKIEKTYSDELAENGEDPYYNSNKLVRLE